MKVIKSVGALVTVGILATLYLNKDSLLSLGKDKEITIVKTEVKIKTYKIDPNIKDKDAYFIDSRLHDMYVELTRELISQDKDIRKRLLFIQDMSSVDIRQQMSELEPLYEIERQKLEKYCENSSDNCLIEVVLTGNSVEGSDIKMNMKYALDPQSLAFFNEVHYVNKDDDKWYSSKLISLNEKRLYPKSGKFQDRKQDLSLLDDKSERVDVSQILEGNSNQWNVRF